MFTVTHRVSALLRKPEETDADSSRGEKAAISLRHTCFTSSAHSAQIQVTIFVSRKAKTELGGGGTHKALGSVPAQHKPGMVVRVCNPSTWAAETRESEEAQVTLSCITFKVSM